MLQAQSEIDRLDLAAPAPAPPDHGELFTDHMYTIDWSPEEGWHAPALGPLADLSLHPGTIGLHYGQVIFEGLKAFRQADGPMAIFRPRENARRFQRSARRMAMPELPEELFLDAVEQVVAADGHYLPHVSPQSLYLRPLMFATDRSLMLRASHGYRFLVLAFVAGGFFGEGVDSISAWVNRDYPRAMPGGTGGVKVAGNYAPTFPAQLQAARDHCQQVLWLDSEEHKWIEEMSGMNLFLVRRHGETTDVVTPPLTGTLLPGVTRDTILTLSRRLGYRPCQEQVSLADWRAGSAPGGVYTEAFACGTAAVVTPVTEIFDDGQRWAIGDGKPGPVTAALRNELIALQRGQVADPGGWLHRVGAR